MPNEDEARARILRYANRLEPINAHDNHSVASTDEHWGGVTLSWVQRTGDNASEMQIYFTDGNQADINFTGSWKRKPAIILSNIEVGQNRITGERNPFDSIRVILTLIATIQEFSRKHGEFIHIVRANPLSQPFFDLLTKLGIYFLSDEAGRALDYPKKWLLNQDYTLFACKYSNDTLPSIDDFVPAEFIQTISDLYQEKTAAFAPRVIERIRGLFNPQP